MKPSQTQILKELLLIEAGSYSISEQIHSDPESTFIRKVAQHRELFDADTFEIIQEMFLRENTSLDTIYSFGYILWRSACGSIVVEEAAINCYNFILERVSPRKNWFLWSQTMLLLAESYADRSSGNSLVNDGLSKDCLQQAINARLRLNEREYRQFKLKFLYLIVSFTLVCYTTARILILWHESTQKNNHLVANFAIFCLAILAIGSSGNLHIWLEIISERPTWGLIHKKLKLERMLLEISPDNLRYMFWAISNPHGIKFPHH